MAKLFVLALTLMAACESTSLPSSDASASSDAAQSVAFDGVCSWSAQYDPSDGGSNNACQAARYAVVCSVSGGGGEYCLSSSSQSCAGDSNVTAPTTSCTSQCHDDEYAIECSSNPGLSGEPPDACRATTITPGAVFYCCPCT